MAQAYDQEALLLTVNEACGRLRISRPTMYQLLNSGRIASIRIGRARRIAVRALEEFVESQSGNGHHAA